MPIKATSSLLGLRMSQYSIASPTNCPYNQLFAVVIISVLLQYFVSAMAATSTTQLALRNNDILPHECPSVDVRNECKNLLQLQGCTVINGFLIITLLPKQNPFIDESSASHETCDYEQYRFPLLREITEYLIFSNVKGLRSIREMFPNLTVIRGRRLFLNYALGISNMPDLELLEFKSLITIQRGHVFIGSSPKLCNLEKINWDHLTPTKGQNYIFPVAPETCPTESSCRGCATGYCWSNAVCQRFGGESVLNYTQDTRLCHEECLGGCSTNNSNGCAVCKHLRDHGNCVINCPENKFLLEAHQRCYTKEECHILGLYVTNNECVPYCSNDTSSARTISEELYCPRCQPGLDGLITIFSLADADGIRGCEELNATLLIVLRDHHNEADLRESFSKLRKIEGHLKIYRSPYLTSLNFLKSLEVIVGHPLESDAFSLVIYDNENLQDMWQPTNFRLQRGGMYVQRNKKLCNRKLRAFKKQVEHDTSKDHIQTSDQEVLCEPSKLLLHSEVLSHHAILLSWSKQQTSDQIEILYRRIAPGEVFEEHSEMDAGACTRINWHRSLAFESNLTDNGTHYSYIINDLEPYTQYACLVKTFGVNEGKDARSEITLVTTFMDIPTPPGILITKKTDVSLTLQVVPQNRSLEVIKYYVVELYELPDNQTLLDTRDFCNEPAYPYAEDSNNYNEDYEACCERREEQSEDVLFQRQMRDEFSCDLDHKIDCWTHDNENNVDNTNAATVSLGKPIYNLRLNTTKSHMISHLTRFRVYVVHLQACNDIGCSSFSMHWERTNHSIAGDRLGNLTACRVPKTHEFHVFFNEPLHPNGLIVSYVIHYRLYVADAVSYQSHIECVTRLQHAIANYEHITLLNAQFNQVAVRVHSLATADLSQWINVTECPFGPTMKVAGYESGHSHGVNTFLVCFLLGASGTLVWVCYKRRCWRQAYEWRRQLPVIRSWCTALALRSNAVTEDRLVLVDEFETVRFHNEPDDDARTLERNVE